MGDVGRARELKKRRGLARLLRLPFARHMAGQWRQGNRGQAMVEFAIILPVLLLILLIAIDFGRVFATYIEMNNTAREAANYAAIHYADGTFDGTAYMTVATGEPNSQGQGGEGALTVDAPVCTMPDGNPIGCTAAASGGGSGNLVHVTVHRSFTFLTPFIGSFFSGGDVDMSATVSAPVLNPLIAQMLPTTTPTIVPTASSSSSSSATPTPTATAPGSCHVPNYYHTYWDNSGGVTDSTKIWEMAGFTGTLTNNAGALKIQSQSIAAGSDVSCSSDMTVEH